METKLKFKIGDKVRVKSLEWYNGNKDANGLVYLDKQEIVFDKTMANLCGKIVQIEDVNRTGYFICGYSGFLQDWMLEDEQLNQNDMEKQMTMKQAQEFVRYTKYAVKNKKENADLQEKLFEIGCKWEDGCQKVQYETCNYLFVNGSLYISKTDKQDIFMLEPYEELEVNDILNIRLEDKTMETKEMIQEEVFAYLNNKKILCTSTEESTNVQQKLFELGIEWPLSGKKNFVDKYLLYIEENKIRYTLDFEYWVKCHQYNRIEVSEILAIQLKEEKPKFDPNTLDDFQKVLVRNDDGEFWCLDFYDSYRYDDEAEIEMFYCISGLYMQCVPYSDETKHLKGTTGEAPEFYQVWKK